MQQKIYINCSKCALPKPSPFPSSTKFVGKKVNKLTTEILFIRNHVKGAHPLFFVKRLSLIDSQPQEFLSMSK